jgi:hypothetical protein
MLIENLEEESAEKSIVVDQKGVRFDKLQAALLLCMRPREALQRRRIRRVCNTSLSHIIHRLARVACRANAYRLVGQLVDLISSNFKAVLILGCV